MSDFSKYGVILLLLLISFNSYASDQKWEYKSRTILIQPDKNITKQINQVAAQNWELVSCSASSTKLHCIFKRKV